MFSISLPFPGSNGSTVSSTFANCPAPPLCFLWIYVLETDFNSRRGQVSTTEKRGNATVISAMVPLANMFGYINNLRSMSQGRAQYSMFFDHYSKVPQNVQDEVTKKIAG